MKVITMFGCVLGFASCVALAQPQSGAIYVCVGSAVTAAFNLPVANTVTIACVADSGLQVLTRWWYV